MASIIYKKLFEVRILHDYFLAKKDDSFFALNTNEQALLLDQKNDFDLDNVLKITPTSSCIELMQNHKIRFIKTRFGFFAAQEVEQLIDGAGNITYKPLLALDDTQALSFKMQSVDPYFQNYTGIPFQDPIVARYYFNNKDDNSDKIFPALALPIAEFDPSFVYEMGTLSVQGGDLKELSKVSGNIWNDVVGNGYADSADKMLLPRKFIFQLDPANLATSVTATLSDSVGLVKSITKDVQGKQYVELNFCLNPSDNCVDEGIYDLQIEDNNSDTLLDKKVFLSDTFYDNRYFGTIEIFPSAGTNFSLLDGAGLLIHRVNADSTKVAHPVFEIRFRSRITYWRFNSEAGFSATDTAAAAAVDMTPIGSNILVIKDPVALVAGVNKQIASQNFPNPTPATLKYETDKQIYSEVYISSVNRFQP